MSAISDLFVKPWFVLSIVFGCFAIITPKILMPMFKQLFGLVEIEPLQHTQQPAAALFDKRRGAPVVPSSSPSGDRPRVPFANPNTQTDQAGGSSMSRSVLAFILPIYAIGIAVYMIYTLFKVYNKKSDTQDTTTTTTAAAVTATLGAGNLDEFSNYNFNDIKWDALNKRFISENEFMPENEYSNLDEDYVQFLKEKRRRDQQPHQQAPNVDKNETTKTGDLNGVLSVMKNSLNNINVKLLDAEKKGGPMDDMDLQNLRLQLANTELQMVKILQAMDSMATDDKAFMDGEAEVEEVDGNVIRKEGNSRRKPHNNVHRRKKKHQQSSSSSSSSSESSQTSTEFSSSHSDSNNKKQRRQRKNRVKSNNSKSSSNKNAAKIVKPKILINKKSSSSSSTRSSDLDDVDTQKATSDKANEL